MLVLSEHAQHEARTRTQPATKIRATEVAELIFDPAVSENRAVHFQTGRWLPIVRPFDGKYFHFVSPIRESLCPDFGLCPSASDLDFSRTKGEGRSPKSLRQKWSSYCSCYA